MASPESSDKNNVLIALGSIYVVLCHFTCNILHNMPWKSDHTHSPLFKIKLPSTTMRLNDTMEDKKGTQKIFCCCTFIFFSEWFMESE